MSEDKCLFVKRFGGFVPANTKAEEFWEKIKMEETVEMKPSRPRNIGFHKKYFVLLRVVADAGGIDIDDLLFTVKVGLGHYDLVTMPGGSRYPKERSIAFHKMDADEFEKFYQRTITLIIEKILPGTDRQDLEDAVRDFS